MATTRIIPMHINKGKSIAQCLKERTEYAMNGEKTNGGEYISVWGDRNFWPTWHTNTGK